MADDIKKWSLEFQATVCLYGQFLAGIAHPTELKHCFYVGWAMPTIACSRNSKLLTKNSLFTSHLKKTGCWLFFLVFLCAISFSCPSASFAESNEQQIKIGIFPLEPITYLDNNGQAQGLYPDLIREIAKNNSWEPVFITGTFAECMERLQTGENDLMSTVAYSEERARIMDYSQEPVINIWGQVFTRSESKINTTLDLENKKVGVMRKGINGKNFRNLLQRFDIQSEIIEYPTHQEIFKAIQAKRIVAGVAPQHYGMRHAGDFRLVGTPIIFSPFRVYFSAKKGRHPEILKQIDSQLHKWKEQENSYYYQRLSYWMGGKEFEKEIIPSWLLISLAVVATFTIVLIFFNRLLKREVNRQTKELEVSEKQYRELVESAESVILRWNQNGEVTFLNKFGLSLFGFSKEEILGKHVVGTIVAESDEAGNDLKIMIDEIIKNAAAYRSNENENICADGSRVYIHWSNKAILDEDGNLQEILSVGTDITEKKDLEKGLIQAQKMEAVGTLAGGIAHDFNNILASIFGFTELAQLRCKDAKLKEDLDQIMRSSMRARDLVRQILAFSRKSDQEKEPLQIALQVNEALKLLRASIPAAIKIKQNIDSKAKVLANPTQIHQIVMNLCTNAYHAMEGKNGILTVSLKETNRITDPDDKLQEGKYLVLEVSDTGVGMDKITKAKIFDPYFTTKEQGKGTGMGLAVIHGIVKSHQGHIAVSSEPGEGSIFRVYLPVFADEVESMIQQQDACVELAAGNNERIILVDDEENIRQLSSGFLQKAGYQVDTFADGTQALASLKNSSKPYDLMITDIAMPNMSGKELTGKTTLLFPDMPIIMCTGYSETMNREEADKLGVKAYLQKPVAREDLLRVVHEVLN